MNTEDLKQLVKNGLAAQQAGSKVAAKATDDIQDDASDEELKTLLKRGNDTAKQWQQRIERAIDEAGDVDSEDNEILEAHYEVSKKIRSEAGSDQVRDLGIIAAGQLALHYWIASFGTLASYAKAVGLTQTAQELHSSAEDAKQADEQHTELAKRLLSAS
ncbi:MAG: ferritin-like domain-containing protein [Janthinobacterium lividum]